MSYFHVAEQNPSLAGLACGPNCRCAACRSPRVGLGDRYIQGVLKDRHVQDGPFLGQPGPSTQPAGPPGASRAVSSALRPVTDTTQVPFRWVCRVTAYTETPAQKGHSVGTGVLISPWHVLTCAHVIYPPQQPYGTVRVVVIPGYSPGSRIVTWARQPAFEANGWAVDPRWNPRECRTSIYFDWGIIRLPKPVGSAYGGGHAKGGGYVSVDNWRNWLPLSLAPSLPGMPCKLAGYSAGPNDPEATHMFQSDGRLGPSVDITTCRPEVTSPSGGIVRSHTEGVTVPVSQYSILITHDADSTETMSGGPVWVDDGGSPKLVAIHTGPIVSAGKRAVLLSQAVQYQIQRLMEGSLRKLPRWDMSGWRWPD
jgi:hypothetical protein